MKPRLAALDLDSVGRAMYRNSSELVDMTTSVSGEIDFSYASSVRTKL